jgi:hypothetical protein
VRVLVPGLCEFRPRRHRGGRHALGRLRIVCQGPLNSPACKKIMPTGNTFHERRAHHSAAHCQPPRGGRPWQAPGPDLGPRRRDDASRASPQADRAGGDDDGRLTPRHESFPAPIRCACDASTLGPDLRSEETSIRRWTAHHRYTRPRPVIVGAGPLRGAGRAAERGTAAGRGGAIRLKGAMQLSQAMRRGGVMREVGQSVSLRFRSPRTSVAAKVSPWGRSA